MRHMWSPGSDTLSSLCRIHKILRVPLEAVGILQFAKLLDEKIWVSFAITALFTAAAASGWLSGTLFQTQAFYCELPISTLYKFLARRMLQCKQCLLRTGLEYFSIMELN